jgi:hypothetical protein
MKIPNYIAIVLIMLFLALFAYVELKPKTVNIAGEEVSLENKWEKPAGAAGYYINRLIDNSNFGSCQDLFRKDIGGKNFILACLKSDKKWKFYYLDLNNDQLGNNQLNPLSEEIEEQITPPY